MFSRDTLYGVSHALHSLKENIRQYAKPGLFTFGRITSAAFGTINSARSFAKKLYPLLVNTPKVKAPSSFIIAVQLFFILGTVTSKMIMNSSSIFNFFKEPNSDAQYKYQNVGDVTRLDIAREEKAPGWFADWTHPDLNKKWNAVLIGIRMSLNLSLFFSLYNILGNCFGSTDLIVGLLTSDASILLSLTKLLMAAFFTYCALITQLALTMPTSLANITAILKKIQTGDYTYSKTLTASFVLIIFNVLGAMLNSQYGTTATTQLYLSILHLSMSTTLVSSISMISTTIVPVSEIGRGTTIQGLISKWTKKILSCCKPSPQNDDPLLENDQLLPSNWHTKRMVLLLASGGFEFLTATVISIVSTLSVASDSDSDSNSENHASTLLLCFSFLLALSSGIQALALADNALDKREDNMIEDKKNELRRIKLENILIDSDNEFTNSEESSSDSEVISPPAGTRALQNADAAEAPLPAKKIKLKFFDVVSINKNRYHDTVEPDEYSPLFTASSSSPRKKKKNEYYDVNEMLDEQSRLVTASSSSSGSDSETGTGFTKTMTRLGDKYGL